MPRMKSTKTKTSDIRVAASDALDKWIARGESYETIASRIGCSLSSIVKWRSGKKMTRMSAKAVLAGFEKS